MDNMNRSAMLIGLMLAAGQAVSADLEAGKAKAATVCAACHGANGVSVAENIPNLAGQRASYLMTQLQAFKGGERKSDIMNVIAPQLSSDDITNVAAHFAAQQGAAAGAKSAQLPNLAKTHVTLPGSFETGFKKYLVKDSAEDNTISVFYANDVAFNAAKAGKQLPDGSGIYRVISSVKVGTDGKAIVGSDGHLIPDQVRTYVTMASGAGWGNDIPEMLRNANWNYAVFGPDRVLNTRPNQAECLACHKPKDKESYLFFEKELVAATKK
jgi:cytochrome c553